MHTSGTESILASAMPVTRLVAPGPLVAMATPTFPVTRAYPSAANTAPCSCRVRICRTPLPSSASYNGMIAPPGYPNTRSTPSARMHCRTISAPLSIHGLFGLRLRCLGGFLGLPAGHPAHHAAQLCTHNLDRMLQFLLTQRGELVATVLVFLDPLAGKRSIPNVGQSFLHRVPCGIAHNFLAPCQVAVLGGIRDRVAHPSEAAFVDQVDNQLHLMQALKIGNLGSEAGFHQSLDSLLDQRRKTAQTT